MENFFVCADLYDDNIGVKKGFKDMFCLSGWHIYRELYKYYRCRFCKYIALGIVDINY